MDQILADSLSRQRFSIQLMAVFAALAGLLAAIGIYGVFAYLVDQRHREFGIRIALGARSVDVLALVLRQGLVPVAAGLIAGIAGALGLTRLLKSLLYEVSATDPLIFGAVSNGADRRFPDGHVRSRATRHSRRSIRRAALRINHVYSNRNEP